jgi:hypothetical protein
MGPAKFAGSRSRKSGSRFGLGLCGVSSTVDANDRTVALGEWAAVAFTYASRVQVGPKHVWQMVRTECDHLYLIRTYLAA